MTLVVLTLVLSTMISCCEMYPSIMNDVLENEVPDYDFPYVSRDEWNARKPNSTIPLVTPVPYVVIHHSYTPTACYNQEDCTTAMRSMQNFHMDGRQWWDIGYNFGIGSDGKVYEGRGWTTKGAHSLYFNTISIGICLIGDWRTALPPKQQLEAVKSLIAAGTSRGYVQPKYKLLGHRQVRETECPGEALYKEIKSWSHHADFPASVEDLVNVPELPKMVKEHLKANATEP